VYYCMSHLQGLRVVCPLCKESFIVANSEKYRHLVYSKNGVLKIVCPLKIRKKGGERKCLR